MSFELDPNRDGPLPGRSVVTIGVFDGVHLGHRALIGAAALAAKRLQASSVVVSFDPHPIEVFAPALPAHRIAAPSVERRKLKETGVDHVWFLPFSRELAAWEPDRFLHEIESNLHPLEVWVGPDFRFGHDRAGDVTLLRARGDVAGYDVHAFLPVLAGDRPVSSTRIRELLRAGDVSGAGDLLGSPFEIEGPVVRGRGLGAKELVATANIEPHGRQIRPARGIYAARATVDDWFAGQAAAVSVGTNPTVGGGPETIEAHLLDFSGDLYGRSLRLQFVERIRDEKHFAGLAELRAAIAGDLEAARHLLSASN